MEEVRKNIRDIPDFPKPGIVFKDLTPVLADPALMKQITEGLAAPYRSKKISSVAGMEARGFIFGSLVAQALDVGFIPLRKPGKLPAATHSVSYELEYGEASLEMHQDIVKPNDSVLLVDDLIATGGTALASCQLIEAAGGSVAGCAFVVELGFLEGRQVLGNYPVHSLIKY
ncbi:MAG: adenine phosphoribosyltransferase [Gammaproteobacteria bacterium]